MSEHQRAAIHALRLFGDSINQSGDLPLNGDFLEAQIQSSLCHIAEVSRLMGVLDATGNVIRESDLQEIFEEPITQLLPNEPATSEGGAS